MTDADDEKLTRHHCVDCGIPSPKTETSFTLISARHGWRLVRGSDEAGQQVLQWRCPPCWEKYRQRSPD